MKSEKVNKENRNIWDVNANDWDEAMGEAGNDWHKELIAPETERLLGLKEGDRLLDVGCGNGLFARRMAKKGIQVRAFDFSENNIRNAKKYDCDNISYEVLDATNDADLESLQDMTYDGIVSNMVFMDMPDIEKLFKQIHKLLTDEGSFVFSIQHPCFNSEFVEVQESNSLVIHDYMKESTSKGTAITTQKQEQFYFHRPISYYLNLGVQNALVIDGFFEPTFEQNNRDDVFSKFPPILIVRMRKA
ncbi:class I SAM-dependent methyltransferase [Sediminitomix flava]|uniref:Methyltransferase family protein n=1 Tax=Sediminitomix flava TaxID=379075 RepID=A0A315ZGG5_SEDFL|nr:class I SAM-dependent methyltransferase [Sediminitomix flava]PWJ44210.1 methyltransferase family protein [Sediminitomix flava]